MRPRADTSDPTTPRERRWGLGDAVGGFALGIVASSTVASIWLAATGQKDLSLLGRAVSQLGLWLGLAGCVWAASRFKGTRSLRDDFGFALGKDDVLPGVGAGLACQGLVWVVALLASPVLGHPDVSGKTKTLIQTAEGVGWVGLTVFMLFVVVGAPIVEEMFFRGLVLRSIGNRLGSKWAVGISAAVFGLAHVQDLPADALVLTMVSLAVVGVVLGWLAERTGRLGPSMVAHFTFNAYSCVLLLSSR